MNTCSVHNCDKPVHGKGFCNKHYRQYKAHGKTLSNTLQDFNIVVDRKTYYEIVLTNNKTEEVARAKIDKEDLEKIRKVGRWSLTSDGYAVHSKTQTRMHRTIMDADTDDLVDHKKVGFTLDNRKNNLRLATQAQNQNNVTLRKNNKSGHRGVFWNTARSKWQAQIRYNNKRVILGIFDTVSEAASAYEKEAKKIHGKFYNKGPFE